MIRKLYLGKLVYCDKHAPKKKDKKSSMLKFSTPRDVQRKREMPIFRENSFKQWKKRKSRRNVAWSIGRVGQLYFYIHPLSIIVLLSKYFITNVSLQTQMSAWFRGSSCVKTKHIMTGNEGSTG